MWLIDTKTLKLCYFNNDDTVEYAILSHRWEEEEVSLQDFKDESGIAKRGYDKIKQSCHIALQSDIQYMWIDTCCIDKTSSAELSEAINSMYKWYENAKICYAYLSDVEDTHDLVDSKWFTRGWTLQELIAPQIVKFFNKNWYSFGSKNGLQKRIASITGIPTRVLTGTKPSECSVAQRMSWAARRVTTRPEDRAYSLMGLFEVNMPMLYGEGGTKAFTRLQEEIIKALNDQSIFAWTGQASEYCPVLASSPANFSNGADIRSTSAISEPTPFSLTNVGLHIELPIMPWAMNKYLAVLQCQDIAIDKHMMPHARFDSSTMRLGILIRRTPQHRQYVRCLSAKVYQVDTSKYTSRLRTVPILLLQQIRKLGDLNDMYGYYFRTMTSEVFGHQTSHARASDPRSDYGARTLGGTYRVACKLPEAKIKKLSRLSQSYILQSTGKSQVLRNVEGLDLDLDFGGHGTVAAFTLRGKAAERSTSSIALLKVGFDFDFNPVCLFYGMSSEEWKLYCQSDMLYWFGRRNVDKEVGRYAGLDQSDCWRVHGLCALRGSRISGLDTRLTHLKIHLIITEEFQNGAKKWIIDISPLDLPFQSHLDPVCHSLEDATEQLYLAFRMKQQRQTEFRTAKDLHGRFDSPTSRADLESSEIGLDDAEMRLSSCRDNLYLFQDTAEREATQVIQAKIAGIAKGVWHERKVLLAMLQETRDAIQREWVANEEHRRRNDESSKKEPNEELNTA